MPTSNSETTLQLLRQHLISTTAVLDLVDGRVHTGHFFAFDTQTVEMPCVILELDGGTANYASASQQAGLYVYAYSRHNTAEALKVYQAVYEALNGSELRHSSLSLSGTAVETFRPTSGYNDQVRAYFYRGTYTVFTAG